MLCVSTPSMRLLTACLPMPNSWRLVQSERSVFRKEAQSSLSWSSSTHLARSSGRRLRAALKRCGWLDRDRRNQRSGCASEMLEIVHRSSLTTIFIGCRYRARAVGLLREGSFLAHSLGNYFMRYRSSGRTTWLHVATRRQHVCISARCRSSWTAAVLSPPAVPVQRRPAHLSSGSKHLRSRTLDLSCHLSSRM